MTDKSITPKHLIVTVHGIRTYGQWSNRLADLVREVEPTAECVNYRYGYFSFVAFLIPPLRWLATRQFREALLRLAKSESWDRIDIVAHSFGTHLVGWALKGLLSERGIKVHTVVLAGSVLRSRFRWDELIPSRVGRLVNECGDRDTALVASQLAVFLTGMAGRVGFVGPLSRRFQNRYFDFGHSDYFTDDFMKQRWVPLLTTEADTHSIDERKPLTVLRGVLMTVLNNIEPVKLGGYALALLALAFWLGGSLLQSETARELLAKEVIRANELLDLSREQLAASLIAIGRSRLETRPDQSVRYAEAAARLTKTLAPVQLLKDAILRYPQYAEIAPLGAQKRSHAFLPRSARDGDVFAMDPQGTLVVILQSVSEDRPNAERVFAIRDIATGRELATYRMARDEVFLTPEPSRTHLLMTKHQSRDRLNVFELRTDWVGRPIKVMDEVLSVVTTNGGWPFYVLRRDGKLLEIRDALTEIDLGVYPAAVGLSAHPSGLAVAVLEVDRVIVLTRSGPHETRHWNAEKTTEFDRAYGVVWGPRADTFLLSMSKGDTHQWVDAKDGELTPIGQPIVTSGLRDKPIIARAENGVRFLTMGREEKRGRAIAKVLDVSWSAGEKRTRVDDASLVGPLAGTSFLEPKAVAITRDGKVGVVSYDVTGASGTQLSGAQTELWDLSSLGRRTSLNPVSIVLRGSGGPIVRMVLSLDGGVLVLWDEAQIAHVFKIDGQLQRRMTRREIQYLANGSQLYARYVDASALYEMGKPRSRYLERPMTALAVVPRSGSLIVLEPNALVRRDISGEDASLPLKEPAVRLLASGDALLVQTSEGGRLLDPDAIVELGGIMSSHQAEILYRELASDDMAHTSLVKGADGAFTLCGWVRSHSRRSFWKDDRPRDATIGKEGDVSCWSISRDAEQFKVNRNFRRSLTTPIDGELIYQVVNRPYGLGVVFVLERVSDSNRRWQPARFSVHSVETGKPLSTYKFPRPLTDDFRGIVWSRVHGDKLFVVGFFSGKRNLHAVCSFPSAGGTCKEWIAVGPEFNEVLFTASHGSNDIHIAFSGSEDGEPVGALIRASDGRVLWSGRLLVEDVFPPLRGVDRNTYVVSDEEKWLETSRAIALGGAWAVSARATRIASADLDESTIQRLEKATAQSVPALDRWDVLSAQWNRTATKVTNFIRR